MLRMFTREDVEIGLDGEVDVVEIRTRPARSEFRNSLLIKFNAHAKRGDPRIIYLIFT